MRFLGKTLHALIKFHPNVYMMCTSSMFTNWPQEVLLLDTLEKRFLSRPHPPLNPYPYRSRLEFGIALDAPEGGVAFSYDAAQVFARERNWGGVITREFALIDWPWTKQLEEWLQTCNAWMRSAVYVRVNVGAFDGTPPTEVVTNSTYPTHVHRLVPIHCLEQRPRARTL